MRKFCQITNGVVDGLYASDTGACPPPETWPAGRIFVPVPAEYEHNEQVLLRATYDGATGTFVPWVKPISTKLSRADVVGLLTPAEWAEMNKYRPAAPPPYDDPDVFWAVSVFNEVEYVDLTDQRVARILAMLVSKGIVTEQRAQTLQASMAAVAATKG